MEFVLYAFLLYLLDCHGFGDSLPEGVVQIQQLLKRIGTVGC
jgi:hypothetical protein